MFARRDLDFSYSVMELNPVNFWLVIYRCVRNLSKVFCITSNLKEMEAGGMEIEMEAI